MKFSRLFFPSSPFSSIDDLSIAFGCVWPSSSLLRFFRHHHIISSHQKRESRLSDCEKVIVIKRNLLNVVSNVAYAFILINIFGVLNFAVSSRLKQ